MGRLIFTCICSLGFLVGCDGSGRKMRTESGDKLVNTGTYITPCMVLRLRYNHNNEWVVEVLRDDQQVFSAAHGSRFSNWFGFVASPCTVWLYSGDVGIKRLDILDDGAVTFKDLPHGKTSRQDYVDGMPDAFWNLLPDSVKRNLQPYRLDSMGGESPHE